MLGKQKGPPNANIGRLKPKLGKKKYKQVGRAEGAGEGVGQRKENWQKSLVSEGPHGQIDIFGHK